MFGHSAADHQLVDQPFGFVRGAFFLRDFWGRFGIPLAGTGLASMREMAVSQSVFNLMRSAFLDAIGICPWILPNVRCKRLALLAPCWYDPPRAGAGRSFLWGSPCPTTTSTA